jgi:sugar/nucleoside kinase (ribokinase family)
MTSNSPPSTVLIVGSMAFDDLELPSCSARDVVGGSATYSALAASLFAPARITAVVGEDFPEPTLSALRLRGVDTSGVERAAGKTFRWAGRYSQNLASRTTLNTELNVFADFKPKLPPSYRDSQIVLLGNIHPLLQLEVLEQTSRPELVVADTMNFWIEGEREALLRVLSRVDLLVINDEELRQLGEEHNIRRAAGKVLAFGPKRLVVKRGEYGAMLFDGTRISFVPAFPLETEIDPTGAGDTFAGALLGYLAAAGADGERNLRRALMAASTVASFCVEDVGTRRLATLTTDEVAARLDQLATLMGGE